MNLLKKLTWKNLKLNKKRTIVTVIGITLSVALITAVAAMYASAIKSLIAFETYEKGDFHTVFYQVPVSDLKTLQENRGIENLYFTQEIGYATLEASKNEYKPYLYVMSFTKEALENLSVKLVEGRLPENEDEIVIPTHIKTNGRVEYQIGDTIDLMVGTRTQNGEVLTQDNPYDIEAEEQLVDLHSKTYKVVGIIERPASNIESYEAPGYTIITYMEAPQPTKPVNVYAKYTKKGAKDHYKVTASILHIDPIALQKLEEGMYSREESDWVFEEFSKAKYRYDENTYLMLLETKPLSENSVGGLGVVIVIVWVIIIFTSVFCIKNSFDISITEKIKQYGMLRSIGATKSQIKKNVFYEATILGIIGIPLGLLFGFLASYILIIISNYYMKEMLAEHLHLLFAFSWVSVIISVLLGIITIYLSAFRSAQKASRISPIDSIRNSANIKIKSNKIKYPHIINRIFGVGGTISYKNLKRNKKKYRTTVISIVVSVAIFIALSYFMSLAFLEVKNTLKTHDYNLSLDMNYSKEAYEKVLETTQLDDIDDVTILRKIVVDLSNVKYNNKYKELLNIKGSDDAIWIYAVGEDQYKKYIKKFGLDYNQMKDKAILIDFSKIGVTNPKTKKLEKYELQQFAYQVGDQLTVTGPHIEDNGTVLPFTIEIGSIITKNVDIIEPNASSKLILSDALFDQYMEVSHFDVYYQSSNADQLQDNLDEVLKGLDYHTNNIDENVRMMKNLYTLIGIFLYGFITVISFIGITNIFNTITTNMELRKQEFAMLKSIGMTKKEFNRMIRLESIFMGLKSLVIGIPIGVGLSYLMYHSLLNSAETYRIPIIAIVISILAVMILITCIMKYSINKINKQNTIETIRNENI